MLDSHSPIWHIRVPTPRKTPVDKMYCGADLRNVAPYWVNPPVVMETKGLILVCRECWYSAVAGVLLPPALLHEHDDR